jgi:aerobic carbon-monoxide dehydrogenase medium subunit
MKPAPFNYVRPQSLDQALRLLADAKDDALLLAGGQSLLPLLGLRMASAKTVIDIGRLDALRHVEERGDAVVLGAAVTHAEIEDGVVPDPGRGLMRRVATRIAYRAIRNQGTIGGSVAMADPAADWPVCLIALEAKARIAGPSGERTIALADLIEDVYTTSLGRDEIITAFEIPRLAAAAKVGVAKMARKTGAFAMSHAIAILNDGERKARIVLGGAASKAICLSRTSEIAQSREASEADLAAAVAADLAQVMTEPDEYALRLHRAIALRALAEARGR